VRTERPFSLQHPEVIRKDRIGLSREPAYARVGSLDEAEV
jgi:hypothetical protein